MKLIYLLYGILSSDHYNQQNSRDFSEHPAWRSVRPISPLLAVPFTLQLLNYSASFAASFACAARPRPCPRPRVSSHGLGRQASLYFRTATRLHLPPGAHDAPTSRFVLPYGWYLKRFLSTTVLAFAIVRTEPPLLSPLKRSHWNLIHLAKHKFENAVQIQKSKKKILVSFYIFKQCF